MDERHPLNFAVVREDPSPEINSIEKNRGTSALVVASGGCTALALKNTFPHLQVDLFDINPTQLQHVKNKITAIKNKDYRLLNIENSDPSGLNQNGVFEGYFRIFRQIFIEFISSESELELFFNSDYIVRKEILSKWTSAPFWQPIFDICFNNTFLTAMFGDNAVQHAERDSYIAYFRQCFTTALGKENSADNYFLQSIFLGCYLKSNAPSFLTSQTDYEFNYLCSALPDLEKIDHYDLISLSNILDWCDKETIDQHITALKTMRPGSTLILRQLNNVQSLRALLESEFLFDDQSGSYYQSHDQSMFYNRIEIATKK
ncbi:BtaA family protein [Endozoicomonas sp. ONNA2]|uniref:BtaA family protein n=1 Tax=Endozoicomonas sp. ONNA2 TaxID=2828741 RepID=UPI00214819A7|nr:BtaA family protein [Endozoicomonas sp. ONNA2]